MTIFSEVLHPDKIPETRRISTFIGFSGITNSTSFSYTLPNENTYKWNCFGEAGGLIFDAPANNTLIGIDTFGFGLCNSTLNITYLNFFTLPILVNRRIYYLI
jgi:hypothetical protein